MEFKLIKTKDSIRFPNWEEFVMEKIELPKNSNCVVVFVTYNLVDATKSLLNYLKLQSSSFDVLVVDNHSDVDSWEKLRNVNNNINLIRTIDNLGSGGGNAIALEWALNREYDFILVTEDDALPVQVALVDEMFENSNENSITKIKYLNENCASFSFHFTVYPYKLLNLIGVPDPSFFMIQDDLEFLKRQIEGQKKLNISDNFLSNLEYTHPTYKAKKSIWAEYFDIRNGLFIDEKYSSLLDQILNFSIKLPYCWSRLFNDGNIASLRLFHFSWYDYIISNKSYALNKYRLNQIQTYTLFPALFENLRINRTLEEVIAENFTFNFSSFLKNKLKVKVNPFAIINYIFSSNKNVVAGNYLSLSHPLFMLSKKITFVESVVKQNEDEYLSTFVWENNKSLKLLRFLAIIVFSAMNLIILLPLIVLKSTISNGIKKIN
jgi:hypothetical protein